jgi:hypothetical protein
MAVLGAILPYAFIVGFFAALLRNIFRANTAAAR